MVIYDNLSTGRAEFLPKVSDRVRFVRGDATNLASLIGAMAGCDFVFHFQANADVRSGREKTRASTWIKTP